MMRAALATLIIAIGTTCATAATLNIELGADLYEGGPRFEIIVDDTVVGTGEVKASAGQSFQFEVPENPKRVAISFTNDAAAPVGADGKRAPGLDRNLRIISVSLGERVWNGAEFEGVGSAQGTSLLLSNNGTAFLAVANTPAAEQEMDPAVEQEMDPAVEQEVEPAAEQEVNITEDSESVPEVAQAPSSCPPPVSVVGYFNGAVQLTPEQEALLAPILISQDCGVIVTGYSSTSGPASANERVAAERAQAVLDFLVQQGVKFASQEVVAVGETEEFGPTQADNRRVVVQLR